MPSEPPDYKQALFEILRARHAEGCPCDPWAPTSGPCACWKAEVKRVLGDAFLPLVASFDEVPNPYSLRAYETKFQLPIDPSETVA